MRRNTAGVLSLACCTLLADCSADPDTRTTGPVAAGVLAAGARAGELSGPGPARHRRKKSRSSAFVSTGFSAAARCPASRMTTCTDGMS